MAIRMDELKTPGSSGSVQILRIHSNQRWNTSKGSKTQTGASTLNHDKASSTVEKQSHQFSHKKIKLCKSSVMSILFYQFEGWTMTADLERRIQAFENKCYRRMLGLPFRTRKHTNCETLVANALDDEILQKANIMIISRLCECISNYCVHHGVMGRGKQRLRCCANLKSTHHFSIPANTKFYSICHCLIVISMANYRPPIQTPRFGRVR